MRSGDPAGGQPANQLGGALRHRRERLGLSLRETARRVGISPGYLVALEQGRNPSTGRPPMPSPPILAAIGRVLEVELTILLDLAGIRSRPSAHLLLYQTGSAYRPPAPAARHLFADRVDAWIEVVDPRAGTETAAAEDVLVRTPGPLGLAQSGPPSYEPDAALAALADVLREAPPVGGRARLGMIFGANSSILRSIEDPAALLASEATWEHDVAAVSQAALGVEPAANICVYRDADVRNLAAGVDVLGATLGLLQTHAHVAVEDRHGSVAIGPVAIETILAAARPAGIGTSTWASLATAAALGLNRDSAGTRHR